MKSPFFPEDQQEASDFFNRYKEDQDRNTANHEKFKAKTNELLNENFEGFDFTLGDKKFRYGVQNPSQVAEKQSDISNFIGKFLGEDGMRSQIRKGITKPYMQGKMLIKWQITFTNKAKQMLLEML